MRELIYVKENPIVDDDAEIRKVIGIYLENEGYDNLKAENGEQAQAILKALRCGISCRLSKDIYIIKNNKTIAYFILG